MKQEKTLVDLVRRYETYPLSAVEKFGIGITLTFFFSMAILFLLMPKIF